MSTGNKVPVIAVGHTRWKLRRLLRALRLSDVEPAAVVWNGEGDFGGALKVPNDGWDTAMYAAGLDACGAQWAVFLNDDCRWFGKDWLASAAEAMRERRPWASMVGHAGRPTVHVRTHCWGCAAEDFRELWAGRKGTGRGMARGFERSTKVLLSRCVAAAFPSESVLDQNMAGRGFPAKVMAAGGRDAGDAEPQAVVVVGANGGAARWVRPWHAHYLASGSPYPVLFADFGGLPADVAEYARRHFDCRAVEQPRGDDRAVGYAARTRAVLEAGERVAVWMDLDTRVRGDISEIVGKYLESGKAIAAAFNASIERGMGFAIPHKDERHYAGVVTMLDGDGPTARRWAGAQTAAGSSERTLAEACRGSAFDLWRPEWIEQPWLASRPGALERARASKALMVGHSVRGRLEAEAWSEFARGTEGGTEGTKDMEQGTVDAVFVLGKGSKHSDEELRYALRSLEANTPWVRNVFVVGEKPAWLTASAIHIPETDPFPHSKDANLIRKVVRACGDPRLSEVFLLCSDDQLVTMPSEFHDFVPRYLKIYDGDVAKLGASEWHKRLGRTLDKFGPGSKYFQPHIWAPMRKASFLSMASSYDWANDQACIVMSLYYNHVGEEGVKNFDHVFSDGAIPSGVRHLAYSDSAFDKKAFRTALRSMFPTKSLYEFFDIPDATTVPGYKRSNDEILEDAIEDVAGHPDLKPLADAAQKLADRSERLKAWAPILVELKRRRSGAAPQAPVPVPCKGCAEKRKATSTAGLADAGMACMECARKHVRKARVLLGEYISDPAYRLEREHGLGELACAEDHLQLVKPAMAKAVRDWRKKAEAGGYGLQELDRIIMELSDA